MRQSTQLRWLIIRNGAVGDTLLLSPLLQIIRRNEPNAWIEILGHSERCSLLLGQADRVISSESMGLESLFGDQGEISPQLHDFLLQFDCILYFSGKPDESLRKRLIVRSDQWVEVYPALPSSDSFVHCTEHYLNAVQGILDISSPPIARVILEENEVERAKVWLQNLVGDWNHHLLMACHVGAGSKAKQAPLDFFLRVVEHISKKCPIKLLLTQGPADEEAVQRFSSSLSVNDFTILNQLSLRELAGVLSFCDLFIGNDSGITHLAAAAGCPTVALFMNGRPQIWTPQGEHVRVIEID